MVEAWQQLRNVAALGMTGCVQPQENVKAPRHSYHAHPMGESPTDQQSTRGRRCRFVSSHFRKR